MGILNNGIFGGYRGKVGNLVSYKLLGKDVIRQVGVIKKPATVKQLACRQEMATVIKFLQPMIEFINMGFMLKAKQAKKYPHNMAVSYNKKNALKGSYPDIAIDYSKVLVTEGTLRRAQNPQVELVPEGLSFSWHAPANMEWPERTHMAMLMAYFPLLNRAEYCIAGARRFTGTDTLPLTSDLTGAYMETYISFICVEDNAVANSVYIGFLNLSI
jgi:hypothetical protein